MKKMFFAALSFFKFNWKSVVAVAAIIAVSVGVLFAANAVFSITDEDIIKNELKKVYKFTSAEEQQLDLRYRLNADFGEMVYLYKTEDGTMISKARSAVTGYKGKAETIIAVGTNGVIKNMVVATYNGDDLTSSINSNYLNTHYIGKNVNAINYFYMTNSSAEGSVNISSGATATMSMTSVSYSVNMSLYYLRSIGFAGGVGWDAETDYYALFKTVLNKDFQALSVDGSVTLQNGSLLAAGKTADGDVAMYIKADGNVNFAAGGTVGDYEMIVIVSSDGKFTHFKSVKNVVVSGYDFNSFDTLYKNKTAIEIIGGNVENGYIQSGATATSQVIFRGFLIAATYFTQADLSLTAGGN